jgi:hypothetical protein
MTECHLCHDPIRFVRMEATGRALPVNPAPHTDGGGNVAARLAGGGLHGFVISKDRLPGVSEPYRFTAHYATCEKQRPTRPEPPEPPPALF